MPQAVPEMVGLAELEVREEVLILIWISVVVAVVGQTDLALAVAVERGTQIVSRIMRKNIFFIKYRSLN